MGSGLSEEPDAFTNHRTNLEAFASFCDIITKSLNITLKPRKKRSQTMPANESEPLDTKESLDTEESTSFFSSITTKFTQVYDLATETFYTPIEGCAPCYMIVISISVLIIVTFIHTIALCSISSTIKSTKKHMKRAIERKPLKRETPRARDHNREKLAYKLYPTKGINQVQTTLPTIFFPTIAGIQRLITSKHS